jgi:L-glyceraldehyde 3-phosphate reductase
MITHETNALYRANETRYQSMQYKRCGNSGVKLPKISLGLWQNFSQTHTLSNARNMIHAAFDNGITHFDLANNYGPPYGTAEETFGQIVNKDLMPYRDELFISSKAGYDMWPGPFGDGGSRKYLIASCDQSLKRCGLEYFDVFYHHRMDPETPIEETMRALDYIVRSGRALYIGISNYHAEETKQAIEILNTLGTPLLVHQPRYNLFDRWIEDGLTDVLQTNGVGSVVFSPLAQGLLTDKYLHGIPKESRAANDNIVHFGKNNITQDKLSKIGLLNNIAQERGQTLAQMAIAWTLNNAAVTSCLVGASSVKQIVSSIDTLNHVGFSEKELSLIEAVLK